MYFSFALYTLATALVLVQGQEFHHEEPEGPHGYTDIGDCKSERRAMMTSRMNAALKPRERHVILNPKPGYKFNPYTVTVKRCNGYCPNRWSPMPINRVPKSFVVQLEHEGGIVPSKCVSVQVMEHTSCKCMCMRNASHCNALQQWDQPNCTCHCKERGIKKPACEKTATMQWDDEHCTCQCRNKIRDCPNGMHWDAKVCKCMYN